LAKQLGNKTECGLLGFVGAMGHDYEAIRKEHPVEGFTKIYTFNSARKMMGTIVKHSAINGHRLFAKGASEMVLYK
jgi:Ca2+ transporting ATPase